MSRSCKIIQFNDAYHLEAGKYEPVGGATRTSNPLVVCSGDVFSPSLSTIKNKFSGARNAHGASISVMNDNMTIVFKGKHMAEAISKMGTKIGVVGNHDFDLGLDQLIKLTSSMKQTAWLLSNVYDKTTKKPLAGLREDYLISHSGIRIGFIGLVEPEWIATLNMNTTNIVCKEPAEIGTMLAAKLRNEGAEVIVALTHSRMPNDVLLAKNAKGIDIILGGHDHEVFYEHVNGIHVAKSGTEFRYASVIDIVINDLPNSRTDDPVHQSTNLNDESPGKSQENQQSKYPGSESSNGKIRTLTSVSPYNPNIHINYTLVPIDSSIPEDEEMVELVEKFGHDMAEKMSKPVAYMMQDMDARASFVRMNESEIGNLLCDVMRYEVEADFAFLNSGTIRTDAVISKGPFTMKDLFLLLPFEDLTCKTEVTGELMIQAMENGVSMWPKHEGRFPQISGFSFTFDPNLPPGKRVIELLVDGKPIDKAKTYTLASKPYISIGGKDGYDCLKGCKLLTPLEVCIVNSVSVSNYFRRLGVIQAWKSALENPVHPPSHPLMHIPRSPHTPANSPAFFEAFPAITSSPSPQNPLLGVSPSKNSPVIKQPQQLQDIALKSARSFDTLQQLETDLLESSGHHLVDTSHEYENSTASQSSSGEFSTRIHAHNHDSNHEDIIMDDMDENSTTYQQRPKAPHHKIHLGEHWAKASIGPPADPKAHHFKDIIDHAMENQNAVTLNPKLARVEARIEGRIKRLPLDEFAALPK